MRTRKSNTKKSNWPHNRSVTAWKMPESLSGASVELRRADVSDAFALSQNVPADLFQFFLSLSPITMDEAGFRSYLEQHYLKSTLWPFVAVDRNSSKLAGMSSFLDIAEGDRRVEIGMTWWKPEFQKTTINPEAKYLMLTYAFEHLNCARVQLKTDERNRQSQRAIEKLGAKREGVLRNYGIQPTGYVRNAVMYSILDSEWPEIKDRLEQRIKALEENPR